MDPKEEPLIVISLFHEQCVELLIFLISVIGILVNSLVGCFTRHLPSMNNPFGRLLASKAVSNVVTCSVYCLYFVPMTTFDIEFMKKNSAQAGFVILTCYDVCIWLHVFIAVNRFCALSLRCPYKNIFNRRHTTNMIIISWTIPVITSVIFHKIFDCDFFYSEKYFMFIFTKSKVCDFISWKIEFYKGIVMMSAIACLEVFTLLFSLAMSTIIISNRQEARRRKETNFLIQALLQLILYVAQFLIYYLLAWRFENPYVVVALTSFTGVLVPTLDGIIVIIFNRQFRKLVTSPFRCRSNRTQDNIPSITIQEVTASGLVSSAVNPSVTFSMN